MGTVVGGVVWGQLWEWWCGDNCGGGGVGTVVGVVVWGQLWGWYIHYCLSTTPLRPNYDKILLIFENIPPGHC